MKLIARSGSRRSDSVNVSSGTTVTTPLNARSAFRPQSFGVMWFSPRSER